MRDSAGELHVRSGEKCLATLIRNFEIQSTLFSWILAAGIWIARQAFIVCSGIVRRNCFK